MRTFNFRKVEISQNYPQQGKNRILEVAVTFNLGSKKLNFSDLEIEMFFVRYDTDGDFEFSKEETGKILDDLDHDRLDSVDKPTQGDITRPRSGGVGSAKSSGTMDGRGNVSIEEFNILAKRAGKLETVINSIVTKIDAVLMKLEKLDMSKNKKKATVNKILGTIKEGDNVDDDEQRKQVEEVMRGELDNWSPDSTTGSIPQ